MSDFLDANVVATTPSERKASGRLVLSLSIALLYPQRTRFGLLSVGQHPQGDLATVRGSMSLCTSSAATIRIALSAHCKPVRSVSCACFTGRWETTTNFLRPGSAFFSCGSALSTEISFQNGISRHLLRCKIQHPCVAFDAYFHVDKSIHAL